MARVAEPLTVRLLAPLEVSVDEVAMTGSGISTPEDASQPQRLSGIACGSSGHFILTFLNGLLEISLELAEYTEENCVSGGSL